MVSPTPKIAVAFLLLSSLTPLKGGLFAAEPSPAVAIDSETTAAIKVILGIEPLGRGNAAAQVSLKTLVAGDTETLFTVLDAMNEAPPIAKNWLRNIASELVQKTNPSQNRLLEFYLNRQGDADARYLVYRWLTSDNEDLKLRLLYSATDDPSLPLRFLAIAKQLETAKSLDVSDPEKARSLYEQALVNARNPEQLKSIADSLKSLGVEVNLAVQLGMISNWYVIAPFDNAEGVGFNLVYPVEDSLITDGIGTFDPAASYEAKSGNASWTNKSTEDAMGMLDLNPVFANEKNAVAYALCRFKAKEAMTAEVRLGSINANKVWVNGTLITANEVYHSGSMIDQYTGQCEIKAGENWALLKICQNNQTDSWAQDWQFQCRITDATGKPIEIEVLP